MPDGDFEVKGLKELDEALKKLPEHLQKRAMKEAFVAGGGVIQQTAQAIVDRKTGNLARAIELKFIPDLGNGNGGVAIYVNRKKAWYGRLVEFGTAPHTIRARRAKSLKIGDTYVKDVQHPGAAAKPFMRPAFDNKKNTAVNVIAVTLRKAIERYAKQVKKGPRQ